MKRVLYISLFIVALTSMVGGQGISVDRSYSGKFKPMQEKQKSESPLTTSSEILTSELKQRALKDTLIIDFESRELTYALYDSLTGKVVWHHHYGELEQYLREMEESVRSRLWERDATEQGKLKKKMEKEGGLKFVVPTHLPPWLQRIVGDQPPQISISGTQVLEIGAGWGKSGIRLQDSKELDPNSVDSKIGEGFIFAPKSDFAIKGEIGRLLELEIRLKGNLSADSAQYAWEGVKDDLSEIKVHYKESTPGELENDIIQEVVIGKTDFRMPGTGLAGYAAGSNEGLFGIKVRSKIGPLDLTTIASIERMEVESKTIDLAGGTNTSTRWENEYIKDQFFFLGYDYRRAYGIDSITVPIINSEDLIILKEKVYYTSDDVLEFGRIKVDSGTLVQSVAFVKMVEGEDYIIDRQRGIVNFIRSVPTTTRIGVILSSDTIQLGDKTLIPGMTADGQAIQLYQDVYVIKESDQKSTDSTFNLMLRNVYPIGITSKPSEFEMSISRYFNPTDTFTQIQGESRYFAEVLGIANDKNEIDRYNDQIFNFAEGYLFIPPYDTTGLGGGYDPLLPFTNPALGRNKEVLNTNNDIYSDKTTTLERKFKFSVTNNSKVEGFNIDWGIEKGTVRIFSGATDYEEGTDYRVEYGSGYVTLLSSAIKSQPTLEVEYQRTSLFLLEKRVFLGVNGLLELPGVGNNSFFSTTFMWQLMKAKKDEIPKVGSEPYNRYLFDSNLKLAFSPYWMTSFVNLLPGVETEQESQAEFDIEIAHSSVKSAKSGSGEAAIDDFSSSSITTSIGTDHAGWFKAAPDSLRADSVGALKNPMAWHSYWVVPVTEDYRPYRNEIYSLDRTNRHGTISPLRLVVNPLPKDSELKGGVVESGTERLLVNPWAGITRPLYGNGDQRENRYLEFWIRVPSGKGNLLIDLGIVAEDLSLDGALPNNVRDVESYNEHVKPEEDVGIDQLVDGEETWKYPDFGGVDGTGAWRVLASGDSALSNYGDSRVPDFSNDPARDNFRYYTTDSVQSKYYANGTQGNSGRKTSPDGEDLNGDNSVIRAGISESYFRYHLSLDTITQSPFYDTALIASNAQPGYTPEHGDEDPTPWHHVRIPISVIDESLFINHIDSVNNPTWSDIPFIRLIWTDFATNIISDDNEKRLEIYDIQIVGSQWRDPYEDSASSSDGSVLVSAVDYESSPSYEWPPRKKPFKINKTDTANDYTLTLEYSDVPSSDTAIIVEKKLGSAALNLSNYTDVRMWVKAEDDGSYDDVWFVYRFGKGTDNFYEFKTKRPWTDSTAWETEHGHVIKLDSLTELKLAWFEEHGEYSGDTLDTTIAYNGDDSIRVYSANSDYPSLSYVTWLAFGVINESGSDYYGKIKINGLRSAGIHEYKGWGFRSDMRLSWADFMDNTARVNYRDAHFRSMTDDVTKPGKSNINAGFSGKINLDKFMASEFGIQLPIRGEVSGALDRPEIIPDGDIKLHGEDDNPDGVREMAGDFVRKLFGRDESGDITDAEKYQTSTRTRTVNTSFNKNRTSKTVPARLFLDRIDIDYSMIYTERENRKGELPEADIPDVSEKYGSELFHIDVDTTRKHTITFDYDFSPSKKVMNVTSWEPFKKSKNRNLRKIAFNLLPERFVFDVLDLRYSYNQKYNSQLDVADTTGNYLSSAAPQERVSATHAMDITYKPIKSMLTFTYSQRWERNFDSYLSNEYDNQHGSFWKQALWGLDPTFRSYGILHSESSRNQTAKLTFSPNLTRWFTFRSSIGSNYNQAYLAEDTASYLTGNLTSTFDISTTFQFRRFFDEWSKRAKRIGGGLKNVSKALRAVNFENVTFDYRSSMSQRSSYLDSAYMHNALHDDLGRYIAYTFGVHNRGLKEIVSGDVHDDITFGGVQHRDTTTTGGTKSLDDTRTTSQSYGFRTKFSLPKPVDISFNSISISKDSTSYVYRDPSRVHAQVTWPNVRVAATTSLLENIGVIKTHFRSLKLSTGYEYKKTTTIRGIEGSTTLDTNGFESSYDSLNYAATYSHGFRPLIKVDFRLKKYDLSFNYLTNLFFDSTDQHDSILLGTSLSTNKRLGKETRIVENSWEINYHRPGRKGRTLRLFRNQTVNVLGNTDYGIIVSYVAKDYTFATVGNSGIAGDQDYEEFTLSIAPRVSYEFTKNLLFEVYYKHDRTLKNLSREYRQNSEFAGIVTFKF